MKKLALTFFFNSLILILFSQSYNFSKSNGSYTNLSSPIVIKSDNWSSFKIRFDIPFTFAFWGVSFDSIAIDDYASVSINSLSSQEITFLYENLKFSFVRNPWDRAVSLYMFQNKGAMPFKDWLLDIVRKDGHPLDKKQPWKLTPRMASTGGSGLPWKCQMDWLVDDSGKVCVDFVGRFENLKRDFKYVCDTLGRCCELPHLNKTVRNDYRSYYDSETKQLVADWHRKDINYFGYTFGPTVKFI